MKTIGLWIISLFIVRFAFGGNIQTTYIYEDPNSRVAQTTFSCDGKQLSLPERTSVESTVSNADKTIWAINFHETSNYSDVDLAMCHDHSPQLLVSISNQLVPLIISKGLIPKCRWDNQQLEVKQIVGDVLYCRFFGATHAPLRTFNKSFNVRIQQKESQWCWTFIIKNKPANQPILK
jgi:hypothetical protein